MVQRKLKEAEKRLQHAVDRGRQGMTVSIHLCGSIAVYRRLADAHFLEQQSGSMGSEWFGITDEGRQALDQARTV
jgi:hypothetical protein